MRLLAILGAYSSPSVKKNEEMEVHVFANSDIDSEDNVCGVFYEKRSDMV